MSLIRMRVCVRCVMKEKEREWEKWAMGNKHRVRYKWFQIVSFQHDISTDLRSNIRFSSTCEVRWKYEVIAENVMCSWTSFENISRFDCVRMGGWMYGCMDVCWVSVYECVSVMCNIVRSHLLDSVI